MTNLPSVADYLKGGDDISGSILDLIGAIGPAASEALPILEEWQRQYEREADQEFIDGVRTTIAAVRASR